MATPEQELDAYVQEFLDKRLRGDPTPNVTIPRRFGKKQFLAALVAKTATVDGCSLCIICSTVVGKHKRTRKQRLECGHMVHTNCLGSESSCPVCPLVLYEAPPDAARAVTHRDQWSWNPYRWGVGDLRNAPTFPRDNRPSKW
jgi:hypothetical protein